MAEDDKDDLEAGPDAEEELEEELEDLPNLKRMSLSVRNVPL